MKNITPLSSSGRPVHSLVFTLILLIIAGFSLQSCLKKDDFDFDKLGGFNYSPNGAAPLIHSKLNLDDILNQYDTNQIFVEDPEHFLTLIYKSTVFSVQAKDLITISNQNANSSFIIPNPVPSGSDFVYSNSSSLVVPTSFNERYDSIEMNSGYIDYQISADINHDAQIVITIPKAKKNNQVFSKTIFYDYQGSVPVNISDTFNLDGYTIGFGVNNQIDINYEITIAGDGNADMSPYNVSIGESFLDMKFRKIFGYVGQQTFVLNQDSVYLDIFNNNVYGTMYFENPQLNIYINNAYGMPLAFSVDLLKAESNVNPPFVINVNGTGVPDVSNPWSIIYPTFAEIGQSKQSVRQLNDANSNIKPAINISPNWVSYHLNAFSNPAGNPVTDQNFVIDTSRFSVDVEAELPMYGWAKDFRLQDTIDFSFGTDIDILDWVLFKINVDNLFPVNAWMQLYFCDSTATIKLDSLLVPIQQIIASGDVGPGPKYEVTVPRHSLVTAKIEKNRIMGLENAEKLIIYARLETKDAGTNNIVKIYSNYYLDVKIGMQAQINAQINP